MAIKAPVRVHQTTTTTGTGTYSLVAAAGQLRNFNAAFSTGAQVPYCATDNNNNFEIGVGALTTGSPDTIARTTILLSSNSNAAVSWSAGTKDIFSWEIGLSDYVITTSSTPVTTTLSDWGNTYVYTGTSTCTFNLPHLTTIPLGFTISVKNSGTALVNITPFSGDQIEALGANIVFAQMPNSFCTYSTDGTVWRQVFLYNQLSPVRVITGAGAVTVALTDYVVVVNKASGAATTVNLPASPSTGLTFHIKDGKGDAPSNNITLTPAAGNIDGASTFIMDQSYQNITIVYNGTQWNII